MELRLSCTNSSIWFHYFAIVPFFRSTRNYIKSNITLFIISHFHNLFISICLWYRVLLTDWSMVTHKCVSGLCHHWFSQWLIAYSTPSHSETKRWLFVNCTLKNKLQLNLNQNVNFFHSRKCPSKCRLQMKAILFRSRCFKEMTNKIYVCSLIVSPFLSAQLPGCFDGGEGHFLKCCFRCSVPGLRSVWSPRAPDRQTTKSPSSQPSTASGCVSV